MKYSCDLCGYSTDKRCNMDKHQLTYRHLDKVYATKVNTKPIENQQFSQSKTNDSGYQTPLLFTCKYCEKKFTFKQAMYHHIKYSCKENKDEDLKELARLMNIQIQQQKSLIETQAKQLDAQNKKIEKLMGKLEIHGSFNTTNIQNFQLLAYRDTDVSHLTDKDYRECLHRTNQCVKHLIEKVHFNPSKPENMNIHISNMKDKYIMIYDGSTWNIADRKRELNYLYDEKEMMLEEWLESNPDKVLRDKFMKYLNNKEDDECLNQIKEEIKMMLYNKQSLYKQLTE